MFICLFGLFGFGTSSGNHVTSVLRMSTSRRFVPFCDRGRRLLLLLLLRLPRSRNELRSRSVRGRSADLQVRAREHFSRIVHLVKVQFVRERRERAAGGWGQRV